MRCSELFRTGAEHGVFRRSEPLRKRLAEHCLARMTNPTVCWGLLIPERSVRDSGFGTPPYGVEIIGASGRFAVAAEFDT
jgi:hypothetical protein